MNLDNLDDVLTDKYCDMIDKILSLGEKERERMFIALLNACGMLGSDDIGAIISKLESVKKIAVQKEEEARIKAAEARAREEAERMRLEAERMRREAEKRAADALENARREAERLAAETAELEKLGEEETLRAAAMERALARANRIRTARRMAAARAGSSAPTPVKENKKKKSSRGKAVAAENYTIELPEEESLPEGPIDLPSDFDYSFGADADITMMGDDAAELTISDGLMLSLENFGGVDIEFIARMTGSDTESVIAALKDAIYQNPASWEGKRSRGWETADEYLSGNLTEKLRMAQEAESEYPGVFKANITALKKLTKRELTIDDIYITLGSPWIPTDIIDEFINHLAGGKHPYHNKTYCVRHDKTTGIWEIPEKTRFRGWRRFEEANYTVWGTRRMDMLYLMENTLNMKTLSVSDSSLGGIGPRVINRNETVKLIEKQEQMIAEFRRFVKSDKRRAAKLRHAYCDRYGNIRKRNYNGSFLEFPDMSPDMHLYPYQKDSVARILMSKNTLLAHDVGSGKTYVMIAAGMELRRLGRSRKNLYVIPNNIILQWELLFKRMYPNARLLTVTGKNFSPKKRQDTLARIRDEDFDAILMTYSCFDMISLSRKYTLASLEARKKALEDASGSFSSSSKLSSKLRSVEESIKKLKEKLTEGDEGITFEELGINTLFLDEAHNYKNVDVETGVTRVLGISSSGSKKARDMMDKVHAIQRANDGGHIIFATGTPVTNSVTDIFIMQKYLQDGELEFLGLHNFDSWIGMFAEKNTEFEIDVDTSSYHLVTRFSSFSNIPELSNILSSVADFHSADPGEEKELPDFAGYTDSVRDGSESFKEYLADISTRADNVRSRRVKRTEDNLLKITTDGRKAALDMRLIDTAFGLEPGAKVLRCAENIAKIYKETRGTLAAQLVFCDSSTPKDGFNLYDELRDLLDGMGVPRARVAFIHDASSDADKERLFEMMRRGELSVMIGSTFKMGIGVNVQERLIALHHLDVPWRPADMVQREGRIIRSGNTNKEVYIFRYITKGSFDAYSWQLLEVKQRFISQILSGNATVRTGADVDEAVLNYAEVKALSVGNPLIKKRVEIVNELTKNRILEFERLADIERKKKELASIPDEIADLKLKIEGVKLDIATSEAHMEEMLAMTAEEKREIRTRIYNDAWMHCEMEEEHHIMDYFGFELVVPAHMTPRFVYLNEDGEVEPREDGDNAPAARRIPYIFARGEGTYLIEIESEVGITRRLENLFTDQLIKRRDSDMPEERRSGLKSYLERFERTLKDLRTRTKVLREELKRESAYGATIAHLMDELEKIDRKLGLTESA